MFSSVEDLVQSALNAAATDIHCFSLENGGTIRFRIHGALSEPIPIPTEHFPTLISTLKFRSGMDISVTTTPQDGQLTFLPGIDLRISTLPSLNGEDCAIRILDRSHGLKELHELGLPSTMTPILELWTRLNSGLILITGSTGSGKSTTMYALINAILSRGTRCVVTLEDPIEYPLVGARQSPVRRDSGYTFSNGLRAVLRQDPDVIMIGEIRDPETAITALEAAYTGHLVLSTLHTSGIELTIQRLMQFSVDPFWLSQSIQGIVSQRLVPIACHCGTGCTDCGFTGRTGRQISAELASLVGCQSRDSLRHGLLPEDTMRLTTENFSDN